MAALVLLGVGIYRFVGRVRRSHRRSGAGSARLQLPATARTEPDWVHVHAAGLAGAEPPGRAGQGSQEGGSAAAARLAVCGASGEGAICIGGQQGWSGPPPPVPPQTGLLPGQHGAYFEVRTVRPRYAPWRKKRVWQQVSAWQMTQPPAGAQAVTVADVSELPGQVRIIGRVGQTGAVEY